MKPDPLEIKGKLAPAPEGARNLQGFDTRGYNLGRGADGAIALGYYRGFQGGYEQAMKDAKAGKMKAEYAFKPHRGESGR